MFCDDALYHSLARSEAQRRENERREQHHLTKIQNQVALHGAAFRAGGHSVIIVQYIPVHNLHCIQVLRRCDSLGVKLAVE